MFLPQQWEILETLQMDMLVKYAVRKTTYHRSHGPSEIIYPRSGMVGFPQSIEEITGEIQEEEEWLLNG